MKTNQLRIIGGKWRSRKIAFPSYKELRPTPDRVRETLFNWLTPFIQNARCLDLFAGSGALGFEASSRGAKETVFVDRDKAVIEQLKTTQQILSCENAVIDWTNADDFLSQSHEPFDIIFLDPPYYQGLLINTCEKLAKSKLVKPGTLIYLEHESSLKNFKSPENWEILKEKKAAHVVYYLAEVRD